MIDGRSGSGKTTFANELGRQLGWHVVHLDDLYPGWHGLVDGAAMVATDVLRQDNPGFRRWDWERNQPAEWVSLDSQQPMIVEGVGAVTAESVAAARLRGAVLSVRLECPEAVRKKRALSRDPGFEPWWDMWAAQEECLFASAPAPDLIIVEQS